MILMKYFLFFYYFLKINTQITHRHKKKYTVKGLKGHYDDETVIEFSQWTSTDSKFDIMP